MKLHLPKQLFTALLAAISFIAPAALTLGSAAWGEGSWAIDGRTSNHIYFYSDAAQSETITTLTLPNGSNGVSVNTNGISLAADAYTNLYICSGYGGNSMPADFTGQTTTIGKVVAGDGVSLTVAENPWQDWKYYSSLLIEDLEYGSGEGAGVFNVSDAESTVIVNKVSGTLSSVTNAGTLTLGTEDSTINLSGTITNTGTMTVNGDVTFSAGSGSTINGVNPGYVITGGGTTNFTGGEIISGTAESPQILSLQNDAKVVVGDGTNTTTMTLGQLRLHDGSTTSTTETFTVNKNAVVTITGGDSSGTGGSAVVLGHWHNGASELNVAGGQLNVLNGSIRVGYDSAASFSITDGFANVAKITFRHNDDVDSLTLEGGRLNVGKGGIIVESEAVNESLKANTKVVLTGGTLGALYSEDAENQGWTLDGRLTTTIGTLTVDTTAVTANDSSSGTGATITIEKASTESSGSAITLTGSGALVIKEFVADTGVSTFDQQEGSSATMTVNSLSVNTGASLTANNALTVGGTIKNDGSLTLNGTIYLSGDIDTSFARRGEGSSSYVDENGEASTGNNGFLKLTSASYWLTQSSDGETGATITLGEDFATLDGKEVVYQGDSAFQLDTDTNGQLYFSTGSITSTQYYISSGDVEITSGVLSKATGYTLQGGNMQIATGVVVNTSAITYTEGTYTDETIKGTIKLSDGAQLKVDALLDNKTAADLLTGIVTATPATEEATPTGKLVIATNGLATGNANLTTTFEGTLELAENISFTFGAASAGNSADGKTINTSSLTGLVLNAGSTLKYTGNGVNTQFANTTVNGTESAATFHIIDGNVANTIQFTGKTLLNNNLNLTSQYGACINIAQLAGGGTLTASGSSSTDEMFYTSIASLNDFTGSLIFTDTSKHTVVVDTGTAAKPVSFSKLQFATGSEVSNTFNVRTDTTVGIIKGACTIDIAETGTLHAFTKDGSDTITLTGSGTYDLGSNTSTNVSGLTDASWSGIVKISNATIESGNGILLNNYGNAASTIQLENVVSFQPNALTNDTCDSDIKLVGEGWKITDGWSSNYSADDENVGIKFTGDFSGGGKLQFVQRNSNSINHRYIFTGDLSAWTGAIEHTSGGANMNVYLVFKDNVSEINTSITGGVGTLNLTADADVHFTKDVDVTSVSVNSGKTATMNATLKAGSVTNSGELKLADKATISGGTMSNVQMSSTGIASTAADSKGSINNALVQLARDASFTIEDMTLTGTTSISATEGAAKVTLTNVTATSHLKLNATAANSFVAAGGVESASISYSYGLGLGSAEAETNSITLNLNVTDIVQPTQSGLYTLTVTLSNFDNSVFGGLDEAAWKALVGFDQESWLGKALVNATFTTEAVPSAETGEAAPTVSYGYAAGDGGSNVGTLTITITGLNVPEPTTATLSLMALAALAARRRRK